MSEDIRYRLLPDGGFVCAHGEHGPTAYAYPTSENARAARVDPYTTARDMLAMEAAFPTRALVAAEYDARMRRLLVAL